MSPGERGRRPAPRGIPLVRVDRRGEEDRELLEAGDLTREEALEERVVVGERGLSLTKEGGVDVTRVPDPGLERLGHEGDRAPVRVGDLFGAVLVEHVVV